MLNKCILKPLLFLAACFILATITGCYGEITGVMNPKGIIAFKERQLLIDASALMLMVVIPVIIMSFAFVWRYHQSQDTSEYHPDWCHNTMLESIWWGVPIAIILILALMTWSLTHKLDPYKRIDVPGEVIEVQVIALPWKWLFIYPKENIATVNFLEIPKDRQVEFFFTNDNVPMSSFFIPQLGSQIYTMAAMRTRLYLVPTFEGTFTGLNSQYNGAGFSDMHFETKVVSEEEYKNWVQQSKNTPLKLTIDEYKQLRQPTMANAVQIFSETPAGLFQHTIDSYKAPHHPN